MGSRHAANILSLAAGLFTGAAIGMLIAPAPGVETRRRLGERAEEGRQFLTGSGKEYFERGRELYEKGRLLADEAAELFDEGRKLVGG